MGNTVEQGDLDLANQKSVEQEEEMKDSIKRKESGSLFTLEAGA